MDVERWLDELGLERYKQAFRDHDVDAKVLPHLTSQDLADIGIASVGHRRALLAAIEALLDADSRPDPDGETEPGQSAAPVPSADAERRQLTVMFCDLVGSTALSHRLDPEEMREVVHRFNHAVAGEVVRYDGFVAQFYGDGVLAYFGWPKAHEDDAERAVRTALAATQVVGELETPAGRPLAVRVGIATGLVVVGELIGGGDSQQRAVVGRTPNLAAQLQTLAEPNTVVLAHGTRRLLGGLFDLKDLGRQQLKGHPEPLQVWSVVGESQAESRFEALHGTGLMPLIGREHELAMLTERWVRAKEGEGQVVLLGGEPGIGKSRLTRALREQLSGEPHVALSHFCSPHHTSSALHPVIARLERAAGFTAQDTAEQKLSKLEVLLRKNTSQLDEVVPLLGALLGVAPDARYPPLDLSPQRRKQRTFEILIEQMSILAEKSPVLDIYEDAHWMDPSTLELLGLLVERVRSLPVLLLIIFRPELTPPWIGQAHVTSLIMNRLGRREVETLIQRVADNKRLPAEILDQIVERTDGIPLFVEELTKTVQESGLLVDAGEHYRLAGPLAPFAIPATLHDSLMARLDRLAPVREVAQIGAVIGREFTHDLVAAVSGRPENQLDEALEQLVASGLVFRRGSTPKIAYTFKHALVQDTAYQALLRARRQELHARIAAVIKEHRPDTVETQPELLAQHYTAAGDVEQALQFWLLAGRRSTERSANLEAVSHLRRGLEVIAGLLDPASQGRMELELQVALGTPLIAIQGYTADDTVLAHARARELCEELGELPLRFQALYGLWASAMPRAEHRKARALAEELLALATREGDVGATITAHRVLGWSLSLLGELTAGAAELDRALALYEPERDSTLAYRYGQDPRIAALSIRAWNLWLLGYPDQSRAVGDQALREGKELKHAFTLAYATYVADGVPSYLCRDFERAGARVEELTAISQEQGFPFWQAYGKALQGAVLLSSQYEEGMALTETGLADLDQLGLRWFKPLTLWAMADAHLANRDAERATELIVQALAEVSAAGERWIEPELFRLSGEAKLCRQDPDFAGAEADFKRAIATARPQGTKSWELRAAMSLARLWRDQGRRAEAHDLLGPVYAWFTEGFGTADLRDAKALLDSLDSPDSRGR